MDSILEILKGRQEKRAASGRMGRSSLRSGIVIRVDGSRYLVNDGASAVACDSLVGERLREGDRVWIGEGTGTTLILGIQGRDVDFAP